MALVWGPLAGYFAKHSKIPLRIEPVTPWLDRAQWPMMYDISMGARRNDPALRKAVEGILDKERPTIKAILDEYGVPQPAQD